MLLILAFEGVYAVLDVRFGSLAVIRANTSLMSASGGKADTQKQFFRSPWLKVCFHPKRSFRPPNFDEFEGLLSANSGHSSLVGSLLQCYVHAAGFNRTIQVPVVHLGDHLLYRRRHGLETPLLAAVNGIGTFKRDHIAIPVRACPTGRRLCSPHRYDLIGLSHC